ncbi:MAG: patatin-like phospholipase family protein [Eubacterium sp.]
MNTLNRKKVGLALGSGGAKGLAHVGVLQALEENNVPIDLICGSSMGAVVGALYATGTSLSMFKELIPQLGMHEMVDYTISKLGIVRGNKSKELIKKLTDTKRFEETTIPFSCIAADLLNGYKKVFNTGYIYDGVRASMSIPGIFVPYELNGRIYVDGGMIERTPVNTAREMGADIVIACDLNYRGQEIDPPKNTLSTLNHVLAFMSWEIARHEIYNADVLLLPDVLNVNPYTTKDTQATIELGYQATMDSMDKILEAVAL